MDFNDNKKGLKANNGDESSQVDWTIELSNQIVVDFKKIADLTYLLPILKAE